MTKMKQQIQDVLIYFGATQTGKSSTLKLLTGDESVKCGDYGKRESTTSDIRLYGEIKSKMSKPYVHIDTIGFGDNRLKYTDEDIRNKIQMEILNVSQSENILTIKAILLTESLVADSYQFSKNIQQISNIFGYLPSKSIIVLGTKSNDIIDKQVLQDRQHMIREKMMENGIPGDHYLTFMTPFKLLNQNQINNQQYSRLEKIINKCEPVFLQSIQQKKQIIDSIALRIQKEQTKTIQNEYQTQRVQYRTENQAYTVTVPRELWRGTMGKILGKNLGGKKIVYHTETHYRDIKVPYTVTEKVKNYTTVSPQYQYCYAKALREFEHNIMKGCKSE